MSKKINRVVAILMERDGMDLEEATAVYEDAKEMILEAIENDEHDEVENIMYEELGLEMDYLFDVLGM